MQAMDLLRRQGPAGLPARRQRLTPHSSTRQQPGLFRVVAKSSTAAATPASFGCSSGSSSRACPAFKLASPQSNVACRASSSGAAAGGGAPQSLEQQLGTLAGQLTRLFPVWIVLAAILAFVQPELFLWFDTNQITNGLIFVMLGMGLTLTFQDISSVFTRQPTLLALGMVLQFTVLPTIGFLISRYWGLPSSLAVGVALVSCMPGGTASNIVAYIAKGDMPLSIMMTTASTLMSIFTTPLLTSLLIGTLVPVDPRAMFLSVLQLVLAPVLVGAACNQYFGPTVSRVRPFTPFMATLVVFFIVGSMLATNVEVVKQSGMQVISALFVLHASGFFLGYVSSKSLGLSNKIARTNSIEVGMQSSALAAVLAKIHFPMDPIIVAPCVLSACLHATLGSLLAGYWAATTPDDE